MTNRERYKQAFSALHTSGHFSLEAEEMTKIQKIHKKNIAAAAAVACALLIGVSGTAYAADIGGIQEKVTMWLYGTKTEVQVTDRGDGSYAFTYEQDGEIKEMVSGGVSLENDGTEKRLTSDELIQDMNRDVDVVPKDDGSVWAYYYDQMLNITDLFDAEGICRLILSHEDEICYLKVTRGEDGSWHWSQSKEPEDAKELYSYVVMEE